MELLSGNRLVTLFGPGGVGKTRLALRVAAAAGPSFPDGVCAVALDSLADPALLAQEVAAELGLRDVPEDAADNVLAHLRDKSLLLLMDNCEHLVDACAEFAGRVLAAAPGVRVLLTSRHVLGVEGERLLPVRSLPVPRLRAGAWVGDADAVTLFTDRAATASPGFEVGRADREVVARLCEQLDGIPLAIELAAAWLSVLSLPDLAQRIDKGFGLPARGGGSRHPRHRTLPATIDWSHRLCSPVARALWARLSVFRGGFSLAAAEAVCSGDGIAPDDVLPTIAELVDKSLITRDEHDGAARYRMLETICQYGHDRLVESGQVQRFRVRHCRHFRAVAEAIAEDWHGPRQLVYMARVRREHANIRAALQFGLDPADPVPDAAWLAVRLHFFWMNCGFVGEGRQWLTRVLALEDLPDEVVVHALWESAYAAAVLGDHPAALEAGHRGVALARRTGDPELLAFALYGLGTAAVVTGQLERAGACFDESIAAYFQIDGSGARLYPPYHASGMVAVLLGDPARGEELAALCLAHLSERGELWGKARAHHTMALARWKQGDLAGAYEHAAECVRLAAGFDDGKLVAFQAQMLAEVALAAGERARAACVLGLVERVWLAVGGSLLTGGAAFVEPHRARKAELRASMGDEAFTAAFDLGTAKGASLDLAAEFLLEQLDRGEQDTGPLTAREMDVAVWVARGRTSREIAEVLSISPRTVEAHVDHILRKLGFTSRVQIGTWVASYAPGRLSTGDGTG
ncbi:LuxR C-terminal-related transcriptional regulator [Actinokineospora sp. PR83]|uniref:ATP-binding protein n=1 Tax=Actinokineospora sp. PR83 TaxID=2884908 RepID=UPI0027E0D6CC|nr:LuxR C-terminal-related transcriptional regulator [Actinokineospora sp. PR83]MCG8920364.1 LuxR C-terminal-related transcriptional regulator [Actinokineospora sp. PR83]